MTICFVSPYLPNHFGGGEKYLFDCARLLAADERWVVSVAIPGERLPKQLSDIRQQYAGFLGQDLHRVRFVNCPLFTTVNQVAKVLWTRRWDRVYYVTDGSLFWSLAKKNILHVQLPFSQLSNWDIFKLRRWQVLNTNSEFTRQVIERTWHRSVDVVHQPFVELPARPNILSKEKIILHVGRFFTQLHTKKQDELIKLWRDVTQQYSLKGWKLVLIGKVEDQKFAQRVTRLARSLPVEIYHDVTRGDLENWFQRAAIYWHATGFGSDPVDEPMVQEHFGITTLEAMSYGCVPVVYLQGGQVEILGSELASLGWSEKKQAIATTFQLISDTKLRQKLARIARKRAAVFNQDRFEQQLLAMVE